jgi:molybdopterin-guanine dinucleotide biosynthesis protein A
MLGVVLAGGASRRLGRDKAELRFEDEPLWQRQLRVLRGAGADRTVVIRRPEQPALPGIECWCDRWAGVGPLAGLHAALVRQSASFVAVLAVDMPGVDAEWFRWLSAHCGPGLGAMARHAAGCEPLAAIYPAEALDAVALHLARGIHSLQRLAEALAAAGHLRLLPLPSSKLAQAKSINTTSEWRQYLPSARARRAASGSGSRATRPLLPFSNAARNDAE